MLKIHFFVNDARFFQIQFSSWIEHFRASGHECIVHVPSATRPEDCAGSISDCYSRDLPFQRKRLTAWSALLTLLFAARIAARERNQNTIFHFMTIIPTILCGIPARSFRRKCVYTVTGLGTVFSSKRLRHRLLKFPVSLVYRFLFRALNCSVSLSNSDDYAFFLRRLKIPVENLKVVLGSGVSREKFKSAPMLENVEVPTILVPARLIAEKGIREAVQASQLLVNSGVPHVMKFLGSTDPGNPMTLTDDEIRTYSSTNPQLVFLGFQSNVLDHLIAADLVCLPSYREGLPTSLVEAMAVGRPIVAFDSVGIRDIILDGKTGLLVPDRSPLLLAEKLETALRDSSLRNTLVSGAALFFKTHLEVGNIIAQVESIYRSLLCSKKRKVENRQLEK